MSWKFFNYATQKLFKNIKITLEMKILLLKTTLKHENC